MKKGRLMELEELAEPDWVRTQVEETGGVYADDAEPRSVDAYEF